MYEKVAKVRQRMNTPDSRVRGGLEYEYDLATLRPTPPRDSSCVQINLTVYAM